MNVWKLTRMVATCCSAPSSQTPAFDQKFDGIALDAGFDEYAIARSDPVEDLLNDAVLIRLRINLEAVTQQPLGMALLGFASSSAQ